MPKAAQATRRSVKGQAIIREVTNTTLQITLPEAGLLPERKCRPLSVFAGDDINTVIPGDEKHAKFRALISKIKPGSGKIDHLIIIPGKSTTVVQVQLQASYDSKGVRDRVESALKAAPYPLQSFV